MDSSLLKVHSTLKFQMLSSTQLFSFTAKMMSLNPVLKGFHKFSIEIVFYPSLVYYEARLKQEIGSLSSNVVENESEK